MKTIVWDSIRISGGNDGIISKAAKKMIQNEAVITQWAPTLLRMELDNVLWRESDNIAVKKLWEFLCTYCYLPRLAGENVLYKAIQTGVNSTEYFAFASGFDGSRYIDLKFNQYIGIVERSGYLVKVDAAKKQIAEETPPPQGGAPETPPGSGTGGDTPDTYPPPDANRGESLVRNEPAPDVPKNTHFYMSAQLDTTRIGRDVQKLVEEVISHLTSVDGAQVDVTLEVNAKSPEGMTQQVVRTVSENCNALRVKDFGFDE
jgi:hypothetical protein